MAIGGSGREVPNFYVVGFVPNFYVRAPTRPAPPYNRFGGPDGLAVGGGPEASGTPGLTELA